MKVLSIIIPIYNGELYIERCLNSLVACSNKNFEIIIINDASNDKSVNIIKTYLKKYSYIKLFNNKVNMGVSYSRNLGLSQSSGKYVYFLDCDDYVNKSTFVSMLDMLDYNYDVICYAVDSIKNGEIIHNPFVYDKQKLLNKEELFENIDVLINVNTITWIKNKIYNTYIIKTNDISFDISISFSEDLLFNVSYLSHINNIFFVNKNLVFYDRDVINSLSRLYEKDYITEFLKSTEYLLKFFKSNKIQPNQIFFIDRKNVLVYSIDKLINSKSDNYYKEFQLKKLYKREYLPFIQYLNCDDEFESKIKEYLENKKIENLIKDVKK